MFKAAVILVLVMCSMGVVLGGAMHETIVHSYMVKLLTTGR